MNRLALVQRKLILVGMRLNTKDYLVMRLW